MDIAYSKYASDFKNLIYVSTSVNCTHRTNAKIMIIGGGQDYSAASMRKGIETLKWNGQKSAFYFNENATHLMLLSDMERCVDFLNQELN